MSSRFQRTSLWFCMLAGGLAAFPSAFAEPTQSLAERRLSIIKRSSTGIVLLDLPSEQRPAAAAAPAPVAANATATTNPSTPANTNPSVAGTSPTTSAVNASSTSAAKPAEAVAPQPAVLNRFFSTMPAPSGRSLQQARRLDAPDQGVPLPFARPAPVPAAEPDAKR